MLSEHIAPCGMNCSLCYAFQRVKKRCIGCNCTGQDKPAYCANCMIKNCDKMKGKFCYNCETFPCKRLKQLDKRYRAKYGMSMIENLLYIKLEGMTEFLAKERKKWKCESCGAIVSVHKKECISCGNKRI